MIAICVADVGITRMPEMFAWCRERFGPCKIDGNNRWVGGRWCYDGYGYKIKFTHSEDAVLFSLRWT